MKDTIIRVGGMSCAGCSSRVESKLRETSGVKTVAVNLSSGKAAITFDENIVSIETLLAAVESLGFTAHLLEGEDQQKVESEHIRELSSLKRELILAICLTAPMWIGMILSVCGCDIPVLHSWWLQLILATPVQFWLGLRFYKNAIRAIKAQSANMDVLIALGTLMAYLFSLVNVILPHAEYPDLYFEASATIITLILLGKYLETLAKGKTSESISKLMKLRPKTARVFRDGKEVEVSLEEVEVGECIVIRPGESLPVDGLILQGSSEINESMLTGESLPITKQVGDSVFAASVNKCGSFTYEATKIGEDTVLAQIIKLVEAAQGSKAPIQKTADRVAAVFVPVVLAVALITFWAWFLGTGDFAKAVMSAVAVLVIACPCSLGLATPTAIMVGTGKGAELGILIKNGEAFETLGRIDTVVLDKTGTITKGEPSVREVIALGSLNSSEILRLAGAAEKNSEHPLGQAIYEKALASLGNLPETTAFKAIPGYGIEATIEGKSILIGTRKLLTRHALDTFEAEAYLRQIEATGCTAMLVAVEGSIVGSIAVADSVKDDSVWSIEMLKSLGVDVYMLTGDNERTAHAIGVQVGISSVLAEVLPSQKADKIQQLQADKKIVAMVGDGINDAPALATADVGIAIGTGTDVAMATADITLMTGELKRIPAVLQLSRLTLKKIRQNLFWAFFYNVIAIPIAALGFLNPVVAAAAMAFSSVSVIGNSLSLRKFRVHE